MNAEAAGLVAKLGLVPLPKEGGYYAPTWTSPARGPDGRPCASAILFLMTPEDFSALHRLRNDELWHFNGGDPAELILLDPKAGACTPRILGPEPAMGHQPQAAVAAGQWQGARPLPPAAGTARGWTLVSCVVAPAWDQRDFELGERDALVRTFPAHAAIIKTLTR